MSKKVWVDKEQCIGCELCVNTCPGVFRLDADGKSECYDPTGDSEENIQMAIDMCPVSCIQWQD